jgi:hypothetical protein
LPRSCRRCRTILVVGTEAMSLAVEPQGKDGRIRISMYPPLGTCWTPWELVMMNCPRYDPGNVVSPVCQNRVTTPDVGADETVQGLSVMTWRPRTVDMENVTVTPVRLINDPALSRVAVSAGRVSFWAITKSVMPSLAALWPTGTPEMRS